MCKRCDEEHEIDRLYEQHGKPLEAEHWGEYLAISEDGETLLAPTLDEAMERAHEAFGAGSLILKVGEVTVGRL